MATAQTLPVWVKEAGQGHPKVLYVYRKWEGRPELTVINRELWWRNPLEARKPWVEL